MLNLMLHGWDTVAGFSYLTGPYGERFLKCNVARSRWLLVAYFGSFGADRFSAKIFPEILHANVLPSAEADLIPGAAIVLADATLVGGLLYGHVLRHENFSSSCWISLAKGREAELAGENGRDFGWGTRGDR